MIFLKKDNSYRYLALGCLLIISLGTAISLSAHDVKIPVIVDTDVALDDLRALTLVLQDGHFQVKAIVTSDGSCSPQPGAVNIRRVLKFLGHENIPVGIGRTLKEPPPQWRTMSEAMGWADLENEDSSAVFKDAVTVITDVFNSTEESFTYICLGPLSNLAEILQSEPAVKDKIAAVYYYGSFLDSQPLTWNTARDTSAARLVFHSNLKIYTCNLPDSLLVIFNTILYDSLSRLETSGAELIKKLHVDEKVQRLLKSGHFIAWDETVALCLIEPMVASFTPVESKKEVLNLTNFDKRIARYIYLQTLKSGGINTMGIRKAEVFENFPVDPALMRTDIRPIVDDIISRYGNEEWKATLLTNELHRHLGIYSILGAKMGIRAREILKATLDDLEVISYAAYQPPLSCLNDGLQAATGASLGRGTIRVETSNSKAEAVFIKGTESLRLQIKDSVMEQIKVDINNAIEKFGNLTVEYFAEIRRLSLRYWLEMDRKEIFTETLEKFEP